MGEFVTTKKAAEMADLTTARIRQLAAEKRIRAQKIGPLWLVHRGDLMAYKATAKPGPKGPTGPRKKKVASSE